MTAQSYLIVKLAAAGDVLLATAMARALRQARPASHIAWLCTPYAAPLLEANPDLDEVLTAPAPPAGRGSAAARLRAVAAWRAALRPWRRHNPGTIVLLAHRSPWLAMLLRAAGLRTVVGFDNGWNWSLAAVAPFSAVTHRLELSAGLTHAALALDGGATSSRSALSDSAPRLELRTEERKAGEAAWRGALRPRWVIAPGGAANPWSAMPNRVWPRERFLELGRRAHAAGIALRWVGGDGDAALTAWLCLHLEARQSDLAGQLGLRETAAVIAASDLMIGNDSLPLVMAQALRRPALGLYGPTPGARIHAPGQPFVQGLAGCGPCYDPRAGERGLAYICPHARCMEQISIEMVWREAQRVSGGMPPNAARCAVAWAG